MSVTTENVVVLFTDMVGSTVLASSLAPHAADELRREHFSVLRQVVAETGGTEVKNLGDGLMVVFATASNALACAVGMQQGVERDNRARAQPVGLRVGLSVGEVSKEDSDYFGDPVVEAARLCALCEGGQILAADVVRAMAGRRSRYECRSRGALALKGLPDPVETVEVIWEPLSETDSGTVIPLPARLAYRPAVGVLGRDADMTAIADACKRVASGAGREVLLVSGEAGLGKTTLVAEAARAAFAGGACVLFGHCEEDLATPYQLFAEALGHYVTHAPEKQLVAHAAAHGSELAQLVPALARRLTNLPPSKATDSDTERFLLFAAVVGLLATVSQSQPVVLVLDDLQWADRASLLLLRHLAASDLQMRVLVLATYRDSELSQSHPLLATLAALRRLNGVSRVELSGLDDAAVVAFLEAAAGHTLEDAGLRLAHAVYRETDGNPFFVGEVLRHLAETAAIVQDASGRWTTKNSPEQIALPDSVREVIGARVGRLGADAGRVLSTAAVIGRDFDLDLLARATKTSEDDLLDILEAAIAAALVREQTDATGRYSFAHALIQHTLYEGMGPTRRARAHRQVGEALEALCGGRPGNRVGELAHHWSSATQPVDLTRAINYSRQAGDAALASLAPFDALRYYAQAVDLYGQGTDEDAALGVDLAIALGTAQRLAADPSFRDTLLDAARRAAELGDTDRLVAAALATCWGAFSDAGVIDHEKVEILELALDRLRDRTPDRARLLATLCGELSYDASLERRQALADEAIAIAESSGDDATIADVVNHVSIPLQIPPLFEQSLVRTAEALRRAERTGAPALLIGAAGYRLEAAAKAGDINEMDRCLEIEGALVRRLNEPIMTWLHTYRRSLRAQIAGDADQAEQLATRALEIGPEGRQTVGTVFGAQLMTVHTQRGTMGTIIPLIEQAVADNPGIPAIKAGLVSAYTEAGVTGEARRLLEDFAANDFELPMDQTWISGMVGYAAAAIECRDPKYAQPLFDRLAPYGGQFSTAGGASAQGPVSANLGGLATVLGRYDEADAYFAQAAAMCARMGAKYYGAWTDFLWGRMLAERKAPGDVEKARELFTKAREVAAVNKYATVERRAIETLSQLR
jgi:class 3 adenylate cyclase/tetratricopeptide (TPR) repeat protein